MRTIFIIAILIATTYTHLVAQETKESSLREVELVGKTSLYPIVGSYGTPEERERHSGLIVYNTTVDSVLTKGTYFWDGEQWNSTSPAPFQHSTAPTPRTNGDIAAGNGITVANQNFTLGGTLSQETAIGQSTFDILTTGAGSLEIKNDLEYKGTATVGHVLTATDAAGTVEWKALPTPAVTTANNGLTKTGNNIALGGSLTKATTINQGTFDLTTNGTGKLNVNNDLMYKGTATIGHVLTATDANGTVEWKALPTPAVTTANNGLTKTGNNIALGGTLIKATEINQGAFNLSTTGTGKFIVNNNMAYKTTSTKGHVLTAIDAAGTVEWKALPAFVVTTASSGLSKTANNIALGGTLTKAATINQGAFDLTTSGTGKLRVNNVLTYKTSSTKGHVLTATDAAGTVAWQAVPAFVVTTASNGLTKTTNDLTLGGAMTKAATINQAAFDLDINGTGKLKVTNNLTYKTASTKGHVLTATDAAGTVAWQALPAYVVTTASNGLTKTANDIALGGAITKAATINQAAFDLDINGIGKLKVTNNLTYKTATAGHVLMANDGTGTVVWKAIPTTGNNGLAKAGNALQFGGALTKATTITQAAHQLNITSTGNNAFNVNKALSISADKVTMGSQLVPVAAAILDVKSIEGANGTATSTVGGVLLPRVILTDNKSLKPFIANGGTAAEKAAHKGLLVYHIGGSNIGAGAKIWNGTLWTTAVTDLPPNEDVVPQFYDLQAPVRALSSYPEHTHEAGKGNPLAIGEKAADGKYYINIKESGSYAFAVRFYGNGTHRTENGIGYSRACYYLTLMVNGKKVDVQEFNNNVYPRSNKLYGIGMLSCANVAAGAKVQILFSYFAYADDPGVDAQKLCRVMTLEANPKSVGGDKTSLTYWKL